MIDFCSYGISITGDGQRLLVASNFPDSLNAEIKLNRSHIISTLRIKQMSPAGFYKTLPSSLHQAILAAPWVALQVFSTAATLQSKPNRLSSDTRIGAGTWLSYRAAHPGSLPNSRPRARALAIYTDDLGACVWDLDLLNAEERQKLLLAVVHEKILVSHDAGPNLHWLLAETEARPAFVLDCMLLMRQLSPRTLLKLFRTARTGGEAARATAQHLIKKENGRPSCSREWIGAALELTMPTPSFDSHQSWAPSILSQEHQQYASAIVGFPHLILKHLMLDVQVHEMPEHLRSQYPWCISYSRAIVLLAEAHVRGVPLDVEAAECLRQEMRAELAEAAKTLSAIPHFTNLYEQLIDPRIGDSAGIEKAAAACDKDGLDYQSTLHKLRSNKAALRTIRDFMRAAKCDGRLHSSVTFTAASGRTISREPTLHNIPRDPRFRGLIRAKTGYLILSADYAAIELRIAAVLVERAIFDLRCQVERKQIDERFLNNIRIGIDTLETLGCPAEPEMWSPDWLNQAIPSVAQTVFNRDKQMMMSIFNRGLDPHLVTALEMNGSNHSLGSGLGLVDRLALCSEQERRDLKSNFRNDRQKAKPANFGLLYGMGVRGLYHLGISQYGFSWTLEEAALARTSWFQLYPEFRLWQFWTKYNQQRKLSSKYCAVWDGMQRSLTLPKRPIPLYQTSTLAGRPIAILNEFRKALSFQNQGTGADILALAIALLPEDVSKMFLFPLHDELVFEVPASDVNRIVDVVVNTMTHAADVILDHQVPIQVDTAVGEAWQKG